MARPGGARVRVYIPDPTLFDDKEFMKLALIAAGKTLQRMNLDFKHTTHTWTHQVRFETRSPSLKGREITGHVGTDDEIYGYVSQGTRPHPIRPRRGKRLRFQSGYRAKTSPRRVGSSAGGHFGPVVYPAEVRRHPGSEARVFDETIARAQQSNATRDMEGALSTWARMQNAKKSTVR